MLRLCPQAAATLATRATRGHPHPRTHTRTHGQAHAQAHFTECAATSSNHGDRSGLPRARLPKVEGAAAPPSLPGAHEPGTWTRRTREPGGAGDLAVPGCSGPCTDSLTTLTLCLIHRPPDPEPSGCPEWEVWWGSGRLSSCAPYSGFYRHMTEPHRAAVTLQSTLRGAGRHGV